jgi:hypothetical protein
MESNQSNITIEHERHEQDLPDLAVRVVSDFAKIVAAEARLVESNIVGAANTLLDRVYIVSILIVLAAAGVVALVGSLGLLLHHWMRWWQVLGIVGILAIVAAEVLRRGLIPPNPASGTSLSRPS